MQRNPSRRADDVDGWRKAKYSCRASAAADAPTKAANRDLPADRQAGIGAPRKYSVVKERAGSRQESGREHSRHYQTGRLRDVRLLTVRSTGVQLVAARAFAIATAPVAVFRRDRMTSFSAKRGGFGFRRRAVRDE